MKFTSLCSLALLLSLLVLLPFTAYASEPAQLTLMVYMTGSDLETNGGAASADLTEMMAHLPAQDGVEVLVMASGSKTWDADISPEETAIFRLTPEGMVKVYAGPLTSMGSPGTLTSFLSFSHLQYPAESYALILWDHGAGPMMGVCFDELFAGESGMDSLSLTELDAALAASPFAREPLSFIGFDACLMATLETAHTVAPYSRYMIASQDTEPASGWSYAFLEEIAGDVSGEATGRRIVDTYFASVGKTLSTITLSVIDLAHISAVSAQMNTLFDSLGASLSRENYSAFAACRVNTKSAACGTPFDYDLVDLIDLIDVYEADGLADCSALREALESAIVYSRSNTEYLYGLSVYYPHYNKERYISPWASRYADMAVSRSYASFLTDMSTIWLGESLADWGTALAIDSAARPGETLVTMQLTPEQIEHFASAKLLVFERLLGNDYQFVFSTEDVTLDESGLLSAAYRGESLYIVDENGQPLTSSIAYRLIDDTWAVPAILNKAFIHVEDNIVPVLLLYKKNAEQEFELTNILPSGDDPVASGKSTIKLSDYDEIWFVNYGYIPTRSEDGTMLPVADWEFQGVSASTLSIGDASWRPAFMNLSDGDSRHALLAVTDTQNNTVYSELIPISNPDAVSLPLEKTLLIDNEYCRLYAADAQLICGMNPVFRLTFSCENKSGAPLQMLQYDKTCDNTLIDSIDIGQHVSANETGSFEIDYDLKDLLRTRKQHAGRFGIRFVGQIEYDAPLFEETVQIDVPVDFAPLYTAEPYGSPLACDEWDGLRFELLDLQVSPEDDIVGIVRIENTTEETIRLESGAAVHVDGIELSGDMLGGSFSSNLPAGCDVYTEMEIRVHDNLPFERKLLHGDALSELGVTTFRELAFDLRHDYKSPAGRITFTLSEPFPYALARTAPIEPAAWPVLYDKHGLTVSLMDTRSFIEDAVYTDTQRMYLCVRNNTDSAMQVYVPYDTAFIDGAPYSSFFSFSSIEPGATVYTCLEFYPPEGGVSREYKEFAFTLSVTDEAQFGDSVDVRLYPTDAPYRLEYDDFLSHVVSLIYEPDRLRIEIE